MKISLEGQTVVVTGGARRLGREIARECARAGANVILTFKNSRDEVQKAVEELQNLAPSQKFAAFELEVSNSGSVQNLVASVAEHFGHATGLVNNAAIFRRTPFETLSESDFDDHIATNLKGPFLLSKAFGDHFLVHQGGSIVNLADIYGVRPLANYIPYCASKAGLLMLTQGFAKALAPHVRVNALCPGTILTPSETQEEEDEEADLVRRIPFGRLGTAEEIAQAVVFLLGGPQFITGAILPVDGGQSLR